GLTLASHELALRRLEQAGARPTSWIQVLLEFQRDWTRHATYEAARAIVVANAGGDGMGLAYARGRVAPAWKARGLQAEGRSGRRTHRRAGGPRRGLGLLRAQRSETRAHFLGQELRLLEGGEVPAFGKPVVVNQLRIGLFGPTPRGLIELVREDAHG